jgi:hypothetical protein
MASQVVIASARGDDARAVPPLVFTQLPVGTEAEKKGPRAEGMLRANWGDSARLVVRDPKGEVRVLSTGFASACDPDVSFDGKRVLFAGKIAAGDRWNIFEITLADGVTRQITRDRGDCRAPIYLSSYYTITEDLPWDQIAYEGIVPDQANEFGGGPATALYTCKLDGSFTQRITYNLSSDFGPAIMPDGRLLYSTWHRASFDDGVTGRIAIEGVNVDGSDRAPYVRAGRSRVQHSPALTSTGLVVFVETETQPWDGAGRLASVTARRPLHTDRDVTTAAQGLFAWPSALADGRVIVSRRPGDGTGSHALTALSLPSGQIEAIHDDPSRHDIQARALVARPRPDGRSSVVDEKDPQAKLFCLDLYTTEFRDRSWLPRGSVKALRVIEGLAGPVAAEGPSPIGVPQLSPRRVMAEVPVEKDGSFHLTLPANTPVQLQVLDDQGVSLRSCGWIWSRSHQAQGCIGCHEDPERTPMNRVPLALQGPGTSVNTPIEGRESVGFRETIAPIIENRCQACHAEGGAVPRLDLVAPGAEGDDRDEGLRKLFEVLLKREKTGDAATASPDRFAYVHPGQARTSPLVWHLHGKNLARPWDVGQSERPVKPLPPDAEASGAITASEKALITRWVDLGAAWRAAPAPSRPGAHP